MKKGGLPVKSRAKTAAAAALIFALIPLSARAFADKAPAPEKPGSVKILIEDTGEKLCLSEEEYIAGAVFASIPADSPEEVLKVQAVIAHTYLEARKAEEAENPTEELEGCVMSDDTENYTAFFTEEQARAFYGEEYGEYAVKVEAAAEYAGDKILTFEGKPKEVPFCESAEGTKGFRGFVQEEAIEMAKEGASCEEIIAELLPEWNVGAPALQLDVGAHLYVRPQT